MQETPETPIDVVNNVDRQRWEARDEHSVLGFSEYREQPGRVIFTHTKVEPEHEGRGIGSRLASAAVADAIARELRITPICPFIRSYLERHPEYTSSVDLPGDMRGSAQPAT